MLASLRSGGTTLVAQDGRLGSKAICAFDLNPEGMTMIRSLMLAVVLAIVAPAALAQSDPPATAKPAPPGAPAGDPTRYQFNRVDDGYLRLDLRTGQVSLCSQRTSGWSCLTVPDDRSALEQEIGRLQNENVALKKELLARGLTLPEGIRPPEPGSRRQESDQKGDQKGPSNAEIDRMISTVERVWRRLLDMIGNLQKDMMNKS